MVTSQGFADVGLFASCARVIAVYCVYIEDCHPISISRRSVVHTVQRIGVAEVDFMINILGKMTRTTPPSLTARWRIACQCESRQRRKTDCLLKRALRRARPFLTSASLRIRPTPNTSRTSPRTIARRKRIAEALGYREQGHAFEQIAHQMKVSMSVAHGYVVEGVNLIPLENAKAVMALALQRLDGLLSAHYSNAVAGDTAATAMTLRILELKGF
jgi:hypothetical protein